MEDLDIIKKNYGEKMSHLCRELFPSILEKDGLLPKIMDNTFNHSFYLYDDIINSESEFLFKDYIYGQIKDKEKKEIEDTDKTPKELLKAVEYNLCECKNEADIQSFRKYYKKDEEEDNLPELTAEQKKVVKSVSKSDRKKETTPRVREKKIDTDKQSLIAVLQMAIAGTQNYRLHSINTINSSREFDFIYNNRKFKVTLTATREKKK